MPGRTQRFKFWGALSVALLGSAVLVMASVANGPDRRIDFEREVPSARSPAELAPFLNDPALWPQWFHGLKKVQSEDGSPVVALTRGQTLRLLIEPPKKEWKRFEISMRVTGFDPDNRLELEFVSDSTGKLERLFSKIAYRIELKPAATEGAAGAQVSGTAYAFTRNWRSRLFGWMIPRILMNQVFYPNLIALAKLPNPADDAEIPSAF